MGDIALGAEEKGLGGLAAESRGSSRTQISGDEAVSERALVLKIDLRMMPVLVVVYIMAFIDRVNIGNARLFSLSEDLHLTGNKYNVALTVFFASYILFEIPANILMKKVKPHVFMSTCMFLFGMLVMFQGLVQNFAGLVTTRLLMGFAEAGIVPGCFYLMSFWYKRVEAQRRFSFFVNAATFAGAFGSLLATGIGHMDGIRGHHAWRWIFILEGLFTCVLSVGVFFIVSDFPEGARWLSDAERAFAIRRIAEDQGEWDATEKIGWMSALRSLNDTKTIVAGFMYFGLSMAGYSLAYFIPTIVSTYGYTAIQSQIHSIPPWAAAFGFSMVIAYLSDKFKRRFPFILFGFLMALAGVITLFKLHHNKYAQYGALCLFTMGVFGSVPLVVCWFVMNLEGHRDRAVRTAWMIAFANTAGIIATFAFPAKDKPTYTLGFSLCIAFLVFSLAANTLYYTLCVMENRKRPEGRKLLL